MGTFRHCEIVRMFLKKVPKGPVLLTLDSQILSCKLWK